MRIGSKIYVASLALALLPSRLSAQSYTLQTTGTINNIYGGPGAYTSDGRVVNGSPFSITITYSTLAVSSSTTAMNDDRQTIYTIPATYSYTVGGYSASGTFGSGDLQISDNHDIGSGQVQDGVAFVNVGGTTTDSPFGFGSQPVYTSFQVNSYDPSHVTLDGTGLDQVSRYGSFPNKFVEFGFTNSTFDTSVLAFGDVTSVSFGSAIAAAPEPDSWLLLIAGFGLTGAALRRRKRGVLAPTSLPIAAPYPQRSAPAG